MNINKKCIILKPVLILHSETHQYKDAIVSLTVSSLSFFFLLSYQDKKTEKQLCLIHDRL